MGASPSIVELGSLGLDRGGHVLVRRAVGKLAPGERVRVIGSDPHLPLHLAAWCRLEGHELERDVVRVGPSAAARWRGAVRAGRAEEPAEVADPTWGLAARGALVEVGGPALAGPTLASRDVVWTDLAPKLYSQACAAQWNPATALDWTAPADVPDDVEDATVQVLTYLIENEQAALAVPARHIARIHPQFREVVAFLATQVADEARHVDVFMRRARLHRDELGTSTVGGRASLQTLVDEPDYALATFLLSVLGEGSFLDLLSFLERHGADSLTRRIAKLVRQDEARHVAFGQALLEHRVAVDPALRYSLRAAIERRHDALQSSAGLNPDVRDALLVLAAGAFTPAAFTTAWRAVAALEQTMHDGRRRRLVRLGFADTEADELAALHTRNFM